MLKDLTQAQRLGLRHIEPIYLIDLLLDGKTLHFSDRDFRYDYGAGVIYYESYLYDLEGLGEEISNTGAGPNSSFSLNVKNQKIAAYDYLIQMQADYEFVRRPIEIYEIRLVEENETFSSDVRVCVQKGYIEKVRDITKEQFVIDCSSRVFFLRDKLGLEKIDRSVFPGADPDDVGKYRNVVIGAVEGVVCRAVKAGGKTTIAQDMTATDPGNGGALEVSDGSVFTSNIAQIDDEQINIDYVSGNTLHLDSTQARGVNSTVPVPHDAGAAIFQVLDSYVYEVAAHPMQSIDNVYVDGVRQITGGMIVSKTGRPGDELSGYEGTAVVFFALRPVVKKQINIETSISTGMHSHTTSSSSQVTRVPLSYNDVDGAWDYEGNAYDGNESTYARCLNFGSHSDELDLQPDNTNLGTVISRKIKIVYSSDMPTYTDDFRIKFPDQPDQKFNGTGGVDNKETIYKTFAGDSWDLGIILHATGDSGWAEFRLFEVAVTVTYGEGVSNNAADGVNFAMTGNTTAETVIGKVVTVDGEGCFDDASGTYTGTAGALIERPDHVFKYILAGLLGQDSGSIGNSFAASGAEYSAAITGGYKFGFVLHEVAARADELLAELARQCRSDFVDASGKYELVFNPDAEPAADLIFDDEDLAAEPVFNFTDSVEIKNALTGYYCRDYAKTGDMGDRYTKTLSTVIAPGDLPEDVEFSAIRTLDMSMDVLSWMLRQKEGVLVEVKVDVKWRAMSLAPGRYFSLTGGLYSDKLYKVTGVKPDKKNGLIHITGCEFTTRV